jgi:hypothetical protein
VCVSNTRTVDRRAHYARYARGRPGREAICLSPRSGHVGLDVGTSLVRPVGAHSRSAGCSSLLDSVHRSALCFRSALDSRSSVNSGSALHALTGSVGLNLPRRLNLTSLASVDRDGSLRLRAVELPLSLGTLDLRRARSFRAIDTRASSAIPLVAVCLHATRSWLVVGDSALPLRAIGLRRSHDTILTRLHAVTRDSGSVGVDGHALDLKRLSRGLTLGARLAASRDRVVPLARTVDARVRHDDLTPAHVVRNPNAGALLRRDELLRLGKLRDSQVILSGALETSNHVTIRATRSLTKLEFTL